MKTNTAYNEHCLKTLRRMPDNFLDCIVTSPPYWGLRDYGHADQLGLEETPEQYVANMVEVFRECRRVLKETGTLWLNLGDSYANAGNGNNTNVGGFTGERIRAGKKGIMDSRPRQIPGNLKPKDLVGIPWRVAFALQADGWYLRSDIIWHKPNPMPESVTDRPTKSHEYIFLLTKSARYYYDAEAVKEKAVKGDANAGARNYNGYSGRERLKQSESKRESGRNRRTVWTIPTKPYSGAHFAVFPPDLIKPCVLAGSPEKVCECCGKPWERVVERTKYEPPIGERFVDESRGDKKRKLNGSDYNKSVKKTGEYWQQTCTCPDSKGTAKGLVYDPFGGSGTTAEVAATYGRNWILSELNPNYIPLINERMTFAAQLQIF